MVTREVVQPGVGHLVPELLARRVAGPAQVLGHLRLAVHPDAPAHQVDEVEVVALPRGLQVDAAVLEPLPVQPLPHADVVEQAHGRALEDARPDPRLDVRTRPGLEDDGLDPLPVEQVGEQQAGRPRPDDGDLGAHEDESTGNLRGGATLAFHPAEVRALDGACDAARRDLQRRYQPRPVPPQARDDDPEGRHHAGRRQHGHGHRAGSEAHLLDRLGVAVPAHPAQLLREQTR